jgi:hypothetical protein
LAGAAEPEVVGDPTGAFWKQLEGVWLRGAPKAPGRVELAFTWQKVGRRIAGLKDEGPEWVKRPAISLTTYRQGEAVHHEYGPIFLEKSGKPLLKWGGRMYEYRFKGEAIQLKEYIPPFQFDEGGEDKPPDPDALSGEWTKQGSPLKREGDS